jgi:hypothetical protein
LETLVAVDAQASEAAVDGLKVLCEKVLVGEAARKRCPYAAAGLAVRFTRSLTTTGSRLFGPSKYRAVDGPDRQFLIAVVPVATEADVNGLQVRREKIRARPTAVDRCPYPPVPPAIHYVASHPLLRRPAR